MQVFLSTLNQMGYLFLLLFSGYLLARLGVVPAEGAGILSKLENNLFIPALVLGTFMSSFTPKSLATAWQFILAGGIYIGLSALFAIAVAGRCTKDSYKKNIYTYGITFSNFGFMGNAVVMALFPDVFLEYLIFVLPFYVLIYAWGMPCLLIPRKDGGHGLMATLRQFLNPMFIAMIIGMVLGLLQLPIPGFFATAVDNLGACMSPIAMVLSGMTIAKLDLAATFKNRTIHLLTAIRLLALPLAAIGALCLLPLPSEIEICIIAAAAMPLGLNTIVVPAAYGLDTSEASGMALISHLFCCGTIPVIFLLFDLLAK